MNYGMREKYILLNWRKMTKECTLVVNRLLMKLGLEV